MRTPPTGLVGTLDERQVTGEGIRPCPKPVKRSTVKRHKRVAKNANIAQVRSAVEARDGERCRIETLLSNFGFVRAGVTRLELAHVAARGMGGNPDLSRDTTENTMLVTWDLHNGGKHSMHGGLVKVQPMTDAGTDGPIAVTFYEQLPTEVR